MHRFYSSTIASLLIIVFSFNIYAQSENRKCVIKSLIGTVKIRRGASVNWIDAKPNMPLKEKDAIRTLIESEVELETSEGSVIKIGENSTVEMAKFFGNNDVQNTKVKILSGSMITNVKKLVNTNSTFEFETPTATAAIRGTIVGLEVNKEKTQIKVFEGKVLVTPRGSKKGVELKENQMTAVTKNQKEITVEKLDNRTNPGINSADTSNSYSVKVDSGAVDSSTTDSTKADSVKIDSTRIDTLETGSTINDSTMMNSYQAQNDSQYVTSPVMTQGTVSSQADTQNVNTSAGNATTMSAIGTSRPMLPASSLSAAPVKLIINSPSDGLVVEPGTSVSIAGTVTPAGATVTVNGRSVSVSTSGAFKYTQTVPAQTDELEFSILGEYKSSSQAVTRRIYVKASPLQFNVAIPATGQEFLKPIIPVNGTVTPGAEVTANSMRLTVASGAFSGQIAIPNEEGEFTIEFEAAMDGRTQKISRTVHYKPEYRFSISSPADRQIVNTTSIQIKGEVQPPSAEVLIMGRKMTVTPTGAFSGYISIPDEEGSVSIEAEISVSGKTRNETRTIIYKKPPDLIRPVIQGILPDWTTASKVTFTVVDRTIDEEITFYKEIDGIKDNVTGAANAPYTLTLEEGTHSYSVYAVDKAGNQSQKLTKTITFLGSSVWTIRMKKPAGDQYLDLPPSAPDDAYIPEFTVEFSIDNLPSDDMKLIREVVITNMATGKIATERIFSTNYIQKDIRLAVRKSNPILVEVTDINGIKKSQRVQIVVR